MYEPVATFCSLPDELILEIVHCFDCVHSYEPQSTAFKEKSKERVRQCKNRERQLALQCLCLSSHRLRRIATPVLYASFVGSATWHNYKSLQLFHRTVSNPRPGIGLQIPFADYLQYVENRLSDHLGNSLHEDSTRDGTTSMVAEYFYLLADVITTAPNICHLSIVSLEAGEVSFWRYILPDVLSPSSTKVAVHGLLKLQSLCFQLHTIPSYFVSYADLFHRILSAMVSVPIFKQLWAASIGSSGPMTHLQGMFKNLQRFNMTECMLDFEEVVGCWVACDGLRHITCEWAYLDCDNGPSVSAPHDLYTGLIRHKTTLETLNLDLREVRFPDPLTTPVRELGSLQPFTALESLGLCETSLLGNTDSLITFPTHPNQYRISELLPANLKSFALLLHSSHDSDNTSVLGDTFASWNLIEDCKSRLPGMQEVSIRSYNDLSAPTTTKAFEGIGVRFSLVKDVTHETFV